MNEIQSQAPGLAGALAPSAAPPRNELGKNEFLKLMITQMNNQDPLNPQENAEFIAQLAQFSSVEGVENLNTTVGALSNSMQSGQALQASALVGRKVHVQGDQTALIDGDVVSGAVKLSASTGDLSVSIADETGQLVRQVALGPQQAGDVRFVWDGRDQAGNRLPDGNYQFSARAGHSQGSDRVPMALSANVNSVTINTDRTITLNLAGMGAVALSAVEEIR